MALYEVNNQDILGDIKECQIVSETEQSIVVDVDDEEKIVPKSTINNDIDDKIPYGYFDKFQLARNFAMTIIANRMNILNNELIVLIRRLDNLENN